ncbi:MAG: thioredoxin family protein [Nitrospinaceae bacterium]
MTDKRQVEIFSAGCAICEEAVSVVNRLACLSCEVTVLDMKNPDAAKRAKILGIGSVPAVVIDGRLAECCGQGIKEESLKASGLGQPLGN